MIPCDDPRCHCYPGHDAPSDFLKVAYDWVMPPQDFPDRTFAGSRGTVRLSIDPDCPLHAKDYRDTPSEAPLREEDEILPTEPGQGVREFLLRTT